MLEIFESPAAQAPFPISALRSECDGLLYRVRLHLRRLSIGILATTGIAITAVLLLQTIWK